LGSSRLCTDYLASLTLFISSIIITQSELLVFLVEAQQEQSNNTTTATDLTKMRNNTIIPQAQDIN
jgi:hypothetical protein